MQNSLPNILIGNNNIDLPANPTYPPPTRMVGPVQLFPADYYFNSPVNKLPLDPQSSQKIAAMGVGRLGTNPEFVLNVVSGPQVPAAITWGGSLECDGGNYPIGPETVLSQYIFGTVVTVGSNANFSADNHICVINTDTGLLYETFGCNTNTPPYVINQGSIWDLNLYQLRSGCKLISPLDDSDGLTSADAAGMPMWPLVLTHSEWASGAPILHSFRFVISAAQASAGWIWPATHSGNGSGNNLPVLGTTFRLQASFDASSFPANMQSLITALKTYGLYFCDGGTTGLISTDGDQAWGDPNAIGVSDDSIINEWLHQIPLSALEIVDNQARVISVTSGQVRQWWPAR